MDRIAVGLMKEFLKSEVASQKALKSVGGPAWVVARSRDSLRHHFAAYALIRGRTWEYITSHVDRPRPPPHQPHKRGELSKGLIQEFISRFEKEAEEKKRMGTVETQPKEADASQSG